MRVSFDINSKFSWHANEIIRCPRGAPSGSSALKRISKYICLRGASATIDLWYACTWVATDEWSKNAVLTRRDEDSSPSFCEELQGSRRSGHLGRTIKVTRDHGKLYYFVICSTAVAWFRFRTSGKSGLSRYSSPFSLCKECAIIFFFIFIRVDKFCWLSDISEIYNTFFCDIRSRTELSLRLYWLDYSNWMLLLWITFNNIYPFLYFYTNRDKSTFKIHPFAPPPFFPYAAETRTTVWLDYRTAECALCDEILQACLTVDVSP